MPLDTLHTYDKKDDVNRIHDTLSSAIENRSVLRVTYYPGTRIVEPHAYGLSSRGNPLLRAFQTEGASASDRPFAWKLFRVDRIADLLVLDSTFSVPRDGYARNDAAMKGGIYAQLG